MIKPGIVFNFLVLPLFFCSSVQADNDYVFILKARGNPYWQTMADGINDAAKRLNVNAQIYFQENDAAAESQLNQCETVIGKNPKALIISAVNPNVGVRCLKQAQAKGIVIGEMDSTIKFSDARAAGVTLNFSVGSDNFLIGQSAAKHLFSISKGSPGKVLILEGAPGSLAGKARVDGFREELQSSASEIKIVASISANWDRLNATQVTSDILLRHPDLDYVYAANDLMGLGSYESLRASKSLALVISVDGTADARKSVNEGKLTATVAQLPYLVGVRALELAIEAQQGKMTEKLETTATPVLTRKMLTAGADPLLKYVR